MATDCATPQVNSSLQELKQMIEVMDKKSSPADQSDLSSQLIQTQLQPTDLRLPPIALTMECIQKLRGEGTNRLIGDWALYSLIPSNRIPTAQTLLVMGA